MHLSTIVSPRGFVTAAVMLVSSMLTASAEFPALITSTTADISHFLDNTASSTDAKLVFINTTNGSDGQLCYIDFSETSATPVIRKITAVTNAKVPVISPNGQYVVYATGKGGEAGNPVGLRSSVYICKIAENAEPVLVAADSAAEPRFQQNVPAGTDTIIYPTLSPNYAWEGIGKTMKAGITYDNTTPVPSKPAVLWGGGGYTGGLSWDRHYLCGGGGTAAVIDAYGDGKPDTVTNFSQACNVSITSSRITTNRVMYLTMGGTDPAIDNGKGWGQWQMIFVSDINRNLISYYRYPSTFTHDPQTTPASYDSPAAFCWHHPEWSNHPEYAVATLNIKRYFNVGTEENEEFETTTYQERIFLINLIDSAYIEVLRANPEALTFSPDKYNTGSGFYWPWLWVKTPDNYTEKPLGSSIINRERHRTRGSRLTVNGYKITITHPVKAIEVFDLTGKRVYHRESFPTREHSITLPSILRHASGIHYVQARFTDGSIETRQLPVSIH